MSTIVAPLTSSPGPTIRSLTIASLRSGEYRIVPSTATNGKDGGSAGGGCRAGVSGRRSCRRRLRARDAPVPAVPVSPVRSVSVSPAQRRAQPPGTSHARQRTQELMLLPPVRSVSVSMAQRQAPHRAPHARQRVREPMLLSRATVVTPRPASVPAASLPSQRTPRATDATPAVRPTALPAPTAVEVLRRPASLFEAPHSLVRAPRASPRLAAGSLAPSVPAASIATIGSALSPSPCPTRRRCRQPPPPSPMRHAGRGGDDTAAG